MLVLDHIAVAGRTLAEARQNVEDVLGVSMQAGGEHRHYGTHNALLGLKDGLYLEAIAINPDAPAPDYPRWFDLDRFSGAPRISNWICRSEVLDELLLDLPQAGVPVALSRGDMRWTMAVPPSGRLPFDNRFPAIMRWQSQPTPPDVLPPSGCRLERLVICHPESAELQAILEPYLSDARVCFETGASAIRAEFETPHGQKVMV